MRLSTTTILMLAYAGDLQAMEALTGGYSHAHFRTYAGNIYRRRVG